MKFSVHSLSLLSNWIAYGNPVIVCISNVPITKLDDVPDTGQVTSYEGRAILSDSLGMHETSVPQLTPPQRETTNRCITLFLNSNCP